MRTKPLMFTFFGLTFAVLVGMAIHFTPKAMEEAPRRAEVAKQSTTETTGPLTDSTSEVPMDPWITFECPEDLKERHDALPKYQGSIDTCIPATLEQASLLESVIGVNSDLETLQKACGPIALDYILPVGEGECMSSSVLYYGTDHEMFIEWLDHLNKRFPRQIHFVGKAMTLDHGIKIGLSLAELSDINDAPIEFAGFAWDYGGQHRSLGSGKLASLDETLQLTYAADRAAYQNLKDSTDITGEKSLYSTSPEVQAVKPVVASMEVNFPRDLRRKFVHGLLEKRMQGLVGKHPRDPVTALGTENECQETEVQNNHQEGAIIILRNCTYEKGRVSWQFSKKDPARPGDSEFEYLTLFETSSLELFEGLGSFFQSHRDTLMAIFSDKKVGPNLEFFQAPNGGAFDIAISFDGEKVKTITFTSEVD